MLTPVGVTVTPQRKTMDFGESDWGDLASITNAVFWIDEAKPVNESAHMLTGTLFVPRGSDLKDGDRVTYQDRVYGIIGNAQWDMNQPFTGSSFGYVAFAIQTGG